MHKFVSLDSRIVSSVDASIPAPSPASLYGKGFFTTIAIYGGKPFLWEKHWRRLENNAGKLKANVAEFSEGKTIDALSKIIEQNNISDGRARITFFDESASPIWPFETHPKTSPLIITGDLRQVPDSFKLTVSPYTVNSRSPLAGIKSCNYLEKLMALDEAKTRGFDEAIQVNECGLVASAVMANVFWLKDGVLNTPSLKAGCLAGTTREFVLENLECREVEATLNELKEADAIFLTSAGLGVTQAEEFDSRQIEKTDHPILELLPTQFRSHEKTRIPTKTNS